MQAVTYIHTSIIYLLPSPIFTKRVKFVTGMMKSSVSFRMKLPLTRDG